MRKGGTLIGLLFGLLALSLIIHIIYLGQIESNTFFSEPMLDSANYHQRALGILNGQSEDEGVLTYNPLYPLILSVLYRFMGEPSFYAVRVVQSILGALNCILIMLVGIRFFDFRTGVLAAVAALLYAPFLFYDGELIQSTWVLFFLLLAFTILPLSPERKGTGRFSLVLLSGLFFGVALLGRPNLLPFLVFLIVWLLFRRVGAEESGPSRASSWIPRFANSRLFRDAAVVGILFLLGAAAVIAPITARNWVKGGEFILTTAHGGINFWIGNNPNADGWYMTPEGFKGDQEGLIRNGREIAQRDLGRAMGDAEVSDYWFGRGWDSILDDPGRAFSLFVRKLYFFWNGYEKPLEGNIYFLEPYSSVLRHLPLRFGIVAPFTLLGLLLTLKRWRTKAGLLTGFVLVYMTTLVLFFVTSRYRLVAVPFLLVHAAAGVWWCLDRLRGKEWKPLAAALVLLGMAAVVSNSSLFGIGGYKRTDLATTHYDEGIILMRRGDNESAAASFVRATELNAENPRFRNNLGIALSRLGRIKEAVQVLEDTCRRWPESPKAHFNLAYNYEVLADLEGEEREVLLLKAEQEYLASLRLNPYEPRALESLARIYAQTGRAQEAELLQRRAREMRKSR